MIGSLADALIRLWKSTDLDQQFRSAWGGSPRADCLPFNDTEARAVTPAHPRPYVIFHERDPIITGHSSGRGSTTKLQYRDCPVDFHVYGRTKAEAVKYARIVHNLFGGKALELTGDRWIQTLIDSDVAIREDDKTWFWMLQYRFRIEREHPASYS